MQNGRFHVSQSYNKMRGPSFRLSSLLSLCASIRAMSTTTTATKQKASGPIAAIAQLRSTSNKLQNLLDIATCARMAKDRGACMLFLPECFGFMGESSVQTLEQAESPILEDTNVNDDMVTQQLTRALSSSNSESTEQKLDLDRQVQKIHLLDGLRTIARESKMWISGGGMHVLGAPSDPVSGNPRVYNTHVILDDQGQVKAIYRKVHLFDVSIPGKVQLRESATTAPGTELVVCDSPLGKLGLSVCYDMRFPEMYIPLVQRGAQILLAPSAFTVPTGAAHWHTLLKARAIENQCYVIAAAQYGRHNDKRESFGHSLAIDPWGRIIADAGGYPVEGSDPTEVPTVADPPSIVTVEIDLDLIESTRQRMPIEQHRQNAVFSFQE